MRDPFRNKRALSQPVTTMILLVVPVTLAGVVVMYACEVIGSQIQMEIVALSNPNVWVYDNGTAYAGFEIDNVGGRDTVISKIEVRGVEASWTTLYYYRTPLIVTDSLKCPNVTGHSWVNFEYTPGTIANFTQASSNIPLPSGYTLVVFIKNPGNLRVDDIGSSVSMTVFTEQSQYYTSCNVKSAGDDAGS